MISSEILGKLGGADVDSFPVEGTATGSSGMSVPLGNVDVPEGEVWLVAVVGNMSNAASQNNYWAQIEIGDSAAAFNGYSGASTVATAPVEIRMRRNRTTGADTFTGTVYTVKL